MRKTTLALIGAVLAIGIGTSAFAADNNGTFNFGQMLPFMQKMHPDFSKEQLQEMYKACHGTGGAAPSANFENMNNMMNPGTDL